MSAHSRPRPAGLPHNSAHKAGGEPDATNPLAKSEELSPGRLTFAGLRTITVGVISGLRQKLSQLAVRSGGGGDGLLERARNASFILLGLTAAIGLGLIAFIAHLGWPNITDGPIPGLPSEHIAVKSAAIAAASPSPGQAPGPVLRRFSAPPHCCREPARSPNAPAPKWIGSPAPQWLKEPSRAVAAGQRWRASLGTGRCPFPLHAAHDVNRSEPGAHHVCAICQGDRDGSLDQWRWRRSGRLGGRVRLLKGAR